MNFAAQKTIYDADLGAVVPEMPQLFFWQGVQYVGQQAQSISSLLGQDEGYLQQYDFDLLVQRSVFPAGVNLPKEEDIIQIPNNDNTRSDYAVKSINASPDGVAITYSLKASN